MKNSSSFFLIIFFGLLSCNQNRYPVGQFPEESVNLQAANSTADDINSDIPILTSGVQLIFSSNRANSQTRDFNLTQSFLDFNWDVSEGVLQVNPSNVTMDKNFESIRDMVRRTESPANEKGPYSFQDNSSSRILLFSREVDGVYSVFIEPEEVEFGSRELNNLRILDETSNEMYPSFYGKNFVKGQETSIASPIEMMVFASDKEGKFDIYEADIPATQSVLAFLMVDQEKVIRKLSLNTTSNDHMPFVYGDLLVFASDRPGGYGGYDLYYSQKTASGWSDPVNLGPKINSEFDEYRPVVSDFEGFANRLMIFSSNRPGGMGGFDLYYVGMEKF